MQTHLILVEGVPFTGKSTSSEFVAHQLGLNDYPAQWISEGVMLQRYFPHVLAVLENKQSISEASLWADWTRFVDAIRTSPTVFVVDSALSYAAMLPLLAADRPPAAILPELKRIANLCTSLHPRVVHLTGDVVQIARASIAERGEGWREHLVGQSEAFPYQKARGRKGLGGVTTFLRETQDFMRVVLEGGGWQTLTLDVSGADWGTNRRAMLEFLGITEVAIDRPALSHDELRSYVGAYAPDDPEGSGDILSVRIEHDTLALHGSRTRIGPLDPLSAARFHVTATRLDAEFVVEDGMAQRLVLFTPDGTTHIFRRVTDAPHPSR